MFTVAERLRAPRLLRLASAIIGGLLVFAIFAFAFDFTASAQSPPSGLVIDELKISERGETAEGIAHQARLTVRNTADADFDGVQRVDYTINDGERRLAFIVTQIGGGESVGFTFNFNLDLGVQKIKVVLGESEVSRTVSVAGADINVDIVGHRPKRGRIVEVVVAITNRGARVARDLTLSGAWEGVDNSSGETTYDGVLQNLAPVQRTTVVMPFQLNRGSYEFSFSASTSSLEDNYDNNSVTETLNIDYFDLQVQLVSVEALGWRNDGQALMAMNVEIENAGVEDMNSFDVGVDCRGEWSTECSSSVQLPGLRIGETSTSEFEIWLPVGDTPSTIFAVENEDTFKWGDSNVIETTITTPPVPEQVWTLSRTSEPDVASYWSDGSADVDLDITFVNNGTDETSTLHIGCTQDDSTVDSCGGEFVLELVEEVYPTVVNQTLRLPQGDTTLLLQYGAAEPATLLANVPERIIGVEREVWDCFSDTSFVDEESENDFEGPGTHLKDDQGIGCAGWDAARIKKWPVGQTIDVWVGGEDSYVEILEETLEDLAVLLNIQYEYVSNRHDADLVVYTGWPKENAAFIGLDCTEFAGCAQNSWDDVGSITRSKIAIWPFEDDDEAVRANDIRATTLHELLHSLTGVKHRHHDRTSVMSYEALNYKTIDGIDRGLYEILADPLVEPGMTFDEVAALIVFSDELNDPPQPEELTAKQILRRAHAAWMDAGTVSYEVRGGWPDCNYHFGWGSYEFGNLTPRFPLWQRFEDGSFHYYLVGHPTDHDASEFWLNRGRNWRSVESSRVFDNTYFRSGFTNPFAMLSNVNIYADDSNYQVISRNSTRVVLEIVIDEPNPHWSRNLTLRIRTEIHPETFEISNYKMTWNFNPRQRDTCDIYTVEGRNPVFGQDFTFPEEIQQNSLILRPEIIVTSLTADNNS